MRVQLIAVPYDSARRGERMGAGPEHLLEAGLGARLAEAGHRAQVRVLEAPADAWRAEIRTAFDLARGVADAVREALAGDMFPLVLSGNCAPAAVGAVAGLRESPAVFWFDAHGDFNTPETTVAGFLDGMALAMVTGRCWGQLAHGVPGFTPVPEEQVALIGARDLDPLEARALDGSAVRRVSAAELRPALLPASVQPARPVYLHLDLDVLDPGEARMNPYAAPGGLTRADVAWAVRAIARRAGITAGALTAFDPAEDRDGAGCTTALELAAAMVEAAGEPKAARDP